VTDTELELPQGWVETTYGNISKRITYGFTNPMPDSTKGHWKITATNIKNGKINYDNARKTDESSFRNLISDKCRPKIGTILITKDGTLGETAIVDKQNICINQSVASIEPFSPEISKFLVYSLQTPLIKKIIQKNKRSTTIAHISITDLAKWNILLPPLNEQKRIVSKIEELFSKIDSAKQSLEQTKLQLEQSRSSLLKSAFEGKVPCTKFIFEKSNWKDTTYNEISKKITYGFTNPMPDSKDGPWKITATNIKNNRIQYDSARKTDLKSYQKLITEKSRPKKDTILITKDGTLGNTAIVDRDNICINQSVASIEPNQSKVLPKFLMFSLQRPMVKQFIEKYKRATTIAHISITDLAKWELDLPSLEEQEQIVLQIEQGFSLIQNTTKIVESSLQNLQTMKMSVLKQAFEGKLVPQDPNDEPASVLLEKIKLKN
jgi:type I restriction enzyme, S subunit